MRNRLTKSDLNRIVKKVINEQDRGWDVSRPEDKYMDRKMLKDFKNRVMFELSREGGSLSDVIDSVRDVCDSYDS
jgi:hypothetical protein